MAKLIKDFLESYDFNRAAIAKQRLANLRGAGRKVRGASIANLMRSARMEETELDEEDLDQLDEVLGKDASASDWISDFVHSDAPQFEGKTKKERIKMALAAHYEKQRNEEKKPTKEDPPWHTDDKDKKSAFKKPHNPNRTGQDSARALAQRGMQQAMKEGFGIEISLEVADQLLEAAYAGLEKEDKPGKVKTAVVKLHPKGVESETVEGWKDTKKPVKESYDEEGNLIKMPKTYKQFMEGITIKTPTGLIHKGTYGNAGKGAKYGETDYDNEDVDKKDDDEAGEKAKRGPKVGSKRGPRTNLGSSKLHQK
jgi:hypothetical protein